MKKLFTLFIISGLFMILISSNVLAWGPVIHTYLLDQINDEGGETNAVLKMCLDNSTNEYAMMAGLEIPDISVLYYFTNGGENYKATHNWNFQQEILSQAVTDDEKCFAYGIALHLIEDSVSHTEIVPEKIRITHIKNWLVHPLIEQKYDSEFSSKYPSVEDKSTKMLSAMYGSKGDRYIEMVEYALGENNKMNVAKETDNLAFALGTFYDGAFNPRVQDNSLYVIYPYIQSVCNFVHPYVGKWNIKDMDSRLYETTQLAVNTFNNWGSRYSISPHGFYELTEADKSTSWYVPGALILLIAISIFYPLYLIIKTKKFRYAFLFLLIIPIIIIAIIIIYMLL